LLAQRISLLYGINAPEFFDKSLFRTLIQQLLKQGVLQHKDDQLCHSDQLEPLAQMLEALLHGGLRQRILRSLVGALAASVADKKSRYKKADIKNAGSEPAFLSRFIVQRCGVNRTGVITQW